VAKFEGVVQHEQEPVQVAVELVFVLLFDFVVAALVEAHQPLPAVWDQCEVLLRMVKWRDFVVSCVQEEDWTLHLRHLLLVLENVPCQVESLEIEDSGQDSGEPRLQDQPGQILLGLRNVHARPRAQRPAPQHDLFGFEAQHLLHVMKGRLHIVVDNTFVHSHIALRQPLPCVLLKEKRNIENRKYIAFDPPLDVADAFCVSMREHNDLWRLSVEIVCRNTVALL